MAHAKVEHDVVIDKLMEVFRSVGYDGASMAELATATNLKKASLYHRFPKGKEEMAHAVLDYVANWSKNRISDVLFSENDPEERLGITLDAINELYDGGRLDCVLRSLSHGAAADLFKEQIAGIFRIWIAAFRHFSMDLGRDRETADRLAEETLIRIQGTLILAKALKQPELFKQTLGEIHTALMK